MSIQLGWNRYGKARVRVSKIIRRGDRHEFREVEVQVALRGDFNDAHIAGDNAHVLPTDTMKNTVIAFAHEHLTGSIETFAARLGSHFVEDVNPVSESTVSVEEILWDRVRTDGSEHPHAFIQRQGERATCVATTAPSGSTIASGLRDLVVLKTTGSAFSDFLRDRFTTLVDTDDRILATSIKADWTYREPEADFDACRRIVREALVQTFAAHESPSVQTTLYEMGKTAIEGCEALQRITLTLPNLHHLPLDLSPLGIDGNREVFLPTSEPHGLIEATVERG